MTSRTLVINPNSNDSVTRGIDQAMDSCRLDYAVDISCITVADGPIGIETDEDISAVVPLVVGEIGKHDDCVAFVIACYSDPGLALHRQAAQLELGVPVIDPVQAAVKMAAELLGR